MTRVNYYKKYMICKVLGYILCVLPTLIAGLTVLPLVANRDAEQTLSALFIICLIITALPLYKWVRKQLKKESISVFLWVITALLWAVKTVPDKSVNGLFIVALTGAIGNTVGAIMFFISEKVKEKGILCGEIKVVKDEENA